MRRNEHGISVYTILSILFFAVLIFVLALPMTFDLNKKQKTEECIRNMKEVKKAISAYMIDRNQAFKGSTSDLVRYKYLKTSYEECPEGNINDKYFVSGEGTMVDGTFEPGKITVKCPNEEQFKDHTLPQDN